MVLVKNNETEETTEFTNWDKAVIYQEYLLFVKGIDAEIL
jgi:hypothetical protein